jgi:hypothetical protein
MQDLIATLLIIAGSWLTATFGYFWLEPFLRADVGYNDAPFAYAAYYAIWAMAVYLIFRQKFLAAADLRPDRVRIGIVTAMAISFATFALQVFPHLPEMVWTRTTMPVEFFWANSSYFLPKSAEILFQQILIAALIVTLNGLGLTIRRISLLVALMFGSFHLTLAISYPNPLYVLRYSVAAAVFGALVPWLLLRMRNGFLASYAIHWTYYALDTVAIHFAFAAPPGS